MTDTLTVPADPPTVLTDEQRDKVRAYYDEHPDGGYKLACRAAGVRTTQAHAKQLIDGDDDLADYRLRRLGLDEPSLFKQLGEMAQNPEHRDQFRAITYGLTAIHGYGAQRVEHTGAQGGPIVTEDRSASLADVARILVTAGALAGAATVGGAAARDALPAARALLPEPPDG